MFKTAEHLYIQVADNIEQLIEKEVLKIGEKLPSVRTLSKQQGISLSTAFQAYYHLESKGLIESRPKSGYYIRFNSKRMPDLPASCEPVKKAAEVTVHEMVAAVYNLMAAPDIVRFSVATPPPEILPAAKMAKAVVQALRELPDYGVAYDPLQGNLRLRRQLALLSLSWGGAYTENDVVTTNGCVEALTLCLSAVTQPGDTIAIESPAYYGALQLAEGLGLKVLEVPTHPATGVDLAYLDKAIPRHKIKACLFVPNFNNPIGCCMPDKQKKELVGIIEKYDIALIEDDIYGDLYFGKQRPATCKTFDKKGNVLYCSSVSKSVAPGFRVGWTMPGKYKDRILQLKHMHAIASPSITHAAVGNFLETGRYENHLRNLRKKLHTQYLRYSQAIMEYFPESARVSRPQGGCVLWIELEGHINTYELFQQALKHKISISPGRIFTLQDRYSNCMRLSYSVPWSKQVDDSLKTLGKLLRRMG
ncbi:DNA-binding transcriptional regulator, MocR family, contains an aminotransferase domain [Chitinophaga jiangningensis]|uniref:DNA-binding transcriptional regulator, MocR family, contains an aminotransferase domain n=1 Tax=Chitinophaga jiangningensis TaxID=1419482 RepID=A0A1M6Y211_9BACT|nr:PLP-dependent aminotransferase family protein [Chitinophaga jiangningensis]SHL12270.1 DNA-binding transcriptional regulator, MocR family, contains an aminotransferase domain [Chitinophaga jiangningensis]